MLETKLVMMNEASAVRTGGLGFEVQGSMLSSSAASAWEMFIR